ncbi:glycoside hydrolase family 15 protein [Candidatus Microgenomates bacterium]|nr:MAG: glycoside hydrolase family 15 protein [Candidatus Microgenomates bacterium]
MADIRDYYLIGDLHSSALVSEYGSIDWFCTPNFDSPSIFARLLDKRRGGSFSIDVGAYEISSEYEPDTAIVHHRFEQFSHAFLLKDFMLPQPKKYVAQKYLVRKITGLRGHQNVTLRFQPRPDYARKKPLLHYDRSKHAISTQLGNGSIILQLPKEALVHQVKHSSTILLTVKENKSYTFVLHHNRNNNTFAPLPKNAEFMTRKFWHNWIKQGTFTDFERDRLVRSAITLKLMQYYPTGAIVAAPTTSLPEHIGGVRNWDYRYVWIRDATFVLFALSILGFTKEAKRFFGFIESVTRKHTEKTFHIATMYSIHGKEVPPEKHLDHLSGYARSKPVRIGNGAADQLQLDVYGALIDAHYFTYKHTRRLSEFEKQLIVRLANKITQSWAETDSGIWEVRNGTFHFTYSKVMCWVGINRVLRMAPQLKLNKKEIKALSELETTISDWIWQNCYREAESLLTQHPKSAGQDATNFLFVLLQFLDKHDPKTKRIVEKTISELTTKDIFVMRYQSEDGLPGSEGSFLLCSYWMISALAVIGQAKRAHELLLKLDKHFNAQQLLPEELDPRDGTYLGNYPQAFSHLGFIMSAYYIHRYGGKQSFFAKYASLKKRLKEFFYLEKNA